MPKLIGIYTNAKLTSCPPQWNSHRNLPSLLFVMESERQPGRKWFKLIHDHDFMSMGYLRCSLGEMQLDEESNRAVFNTSSGSVYEIELGQKVPEEEWKHHITKTAAAEEENQEDPVEDKNDADEPKADDDGDSEEPEAGQNVDGGQSEDSQSLDDEQS